MDWEVVNYDMVRDFCLREGIREIFLSSLDSHDAQEFYKRFASSLPLRLLDEEHWYEAIAGEHVLLVYEAGNFHLSGNGRRYSWQEFWQVLVGRVSETLGENVFVKEEFVAVPATYKGLKRYVEAFDSGFRHVYLVDDNGNYRGVINKFQFREHFLAHDFEPMHPVGIQEQTDGGSMREEADRCICEQHMEELPVLRGEKIVAVATKLRRRHQLPLVRWELISEAVFLDFLAGARRVLISSDAGELKEFRNHFKDCAEIVAYSDENLAGYYSGDFDMLVCSSAIWPKARTRQYMADELFLDLLEEEVRRRLEEKGVGYLFVDAGGAAPGMEHQVDLSSYISPLFHNRVMDDHYVSGDIDDNGIFIKDGIRRTVNVPDAWEHSIFMAGSCQCIGMTARDEETISSYLQRFLNQKGMRYRVVNCTGVFNLRDWDSDWYGGISHDINGLYRIMHMDLKAGDIVVQFCNNAWRIGAPFSLEPMKKFSLAEWFSSARCSRGKYFIDPYSLSHMTSRGYEEAARGILKYLEHDLHQATLSSERD